MPVRNATATAATSASHLLPVGAGSLVTPDGLRAQRGRLQPAPQGPAGLLPARPDDERQAPDRMMVPQRAALPAAGTHQALHKQSPQQSGGVRRPAQGGRDIKQVFVLDWDDCLRIEKGMNFQLMHNALTLAAREHGTKYPELTQAVDRLHAQMRSGSPPGDGDPLLRRDQEDFARHLLPRPEIFEARVLQDFVSKMLPDVPKDRAQAIHNILEAHFNRQYQAVAQSRAGSVLSQENLPFPKVKLELTPGAQELLDRSRTPESRVLLISNRGHADVEKEVNQLGMAHYFDVVAGAPVVSQDKPPPGVPAELRLQLRSALDSGDDQALLAALVRAVPMAVARPQAAAVHDSTGLPTLPPQDRLPAPMRDRLLDALQRGDETALQGALVAATPFAHAELSRRLMASLRSGGSEALRQSLDEAVAYAHPDAVTAGRVDLKPAPKRLLDSLARLSVQPEVPIVSYGDQVTDVKQLAGADNQRRMLEGVIVNSQHPRVGENIVVDGIPTRILSRLPAE